jgi:hypothetical protein
MQVDVREIRPGRYRRVLLLGNRPRPLCDCDGGHPDPESARDCPMAMRSLDTIGSNESLQSIQGACKAAPGLS